MNYAVMNPVDASGMQWMSTVPTDRGAPAFRRVGVSIEGFLFDRNPSVDNFIIVLDEWMKKSVPA